MALNAFIISFGVLICTIHNICGRELVAEWKKSLERGESTSRIGLSTRYIECGRRHEDIIKKKLEENYGGMFDQGIKHNYIANTRESDYGSNNILRGGECVNSDDGYQNIKNNDQTNTESNNGKNNTVGSGSNNGSINGSRNTNGTDNIPGSGNDGPIIVSVGNQNGNGNDNINSGSGGDTGGK